MGQYQEWLHAQEADKRLKTEVEALETEILYLKEHITLLEQTVPETENVILQALLAYLHNQVQSLEAASKDQDSVPAQADWNGLLRPETPQPSAAGSVPSTYFPGMYFQSERLPRDMLAFFEERRKTDREISSWQPREQDVETEEHPVDAETQRLNENIQRWFERWHREITGMAQTEMQNGE